MPRILILYFSLSGSTARVAEAMAFGLRAKACRVDLCNLKDERPPRLDGYDLLGIGSPAYYFRPPFNVMDYLNNLPDFEGLPSFVFTLHGTYPGDAGNAIRKALEKKGSNVLGYFPCHGADLFVGYLKAGILFSPDHPNREELLQAEEFGRKIATIMAGEG